MIKESTEIYLRDVYDHVVQIIDTIETFREMLSSMLDIYLSSLSNRMNQVMKVLTIIATIFIPLTFLAGLYGMNFKYMPELEWHWGYPFVLTIMVSVVCIMLFFSENGNGCECTVDLVRHSNIYSFRNSADHHRAALFYAGT